MIAERQKGLISRFLARMPARTRDAEPEPAAPGAWADNGERPVRGLVDAPLREPRCLIVTAYQDFLSTLAILLDTVEDLQDRPSGSIRIVFGANTDTARGLGGAGRSVAKAARAHFLGARGFSVGDLANLRAVLAMQAVERGVIALRVYDPALAEPLVGRRAALLHAKLFVGERSALSGSANFSAGGLRRNREVVDDALPWPDLARIMRMGWRA